MLPRTRTCRRRGRKRRTGPSEEPGAPPPPPPPPPCPPAEASGPAGQRRISLRRYICPRCPPARALPDPGYRGSPLQMIWMGPSAQGARCSGQSREGGNGGELSDGKHDSPRSAMERRHPQRPPARVLDARNGPNKVFKKARSAPCRRRAGITRRVLVPPRCLPVQGREERAGAAARALSSRLRTRTGSAWMCTAVWGGRRRRGASKKLRYGHTHG